MKNLFKKSPVFLILLLAMLFSSCEKDLYEEQIRSSQKFKIKEVKFDDLFKDEKFNSLMRSMNNNNITSRSAFEDQFGFTIYNDKVRIIENDTITSYTMLILRDGVTDKSYFENLVIQKDIYNNKKGAIYKYIPSKILPTGHNSFKFEGDILKTKINAGGTTEVQSLVSCIITITVCCEHPEGNTVGPLHIATGNCNNSNFMYDLSIVGLCSEGGTGGPTAPIDFDPGFTNNPTPGGGGGGPSDPITPAAPQDYQVPEIITSPVLNPENVDEIRNINLFYQSLTPQQLEWVTNNRQHQNTLIQYRGQNNWSDESKLFASSLIDLARNEEDQELVSYLINLSIVTKQNGYFENLFDSNYYSLINPYTVVDTEAYSHYWQVYFSMQCALARFKLSQEAGWNNLQPWQQNAKVYWEASKEMVHLGLDLIGLAPVVGEVADLTNGVIYSIEGDGVSASLSFASTIPVAGWFSAGIKFAKRADGLAYTVKAANNLISFGAYNSKKFRAAIGLFPGDPRQAHHLIPRDFADNALVQKAAQANTNQGFHMHSALNGIPMPTTNHLTGHNLYSQKVLQRLNYLNTISPTPQIAYQQINNYINHIKIIIENNQNMNLGQISNLID
ncbi:AHH domain-containing protein [Flavobacterium sp. j3]|uniref:AHH domain-containing protein n=1 Tax=Flavobacterium aureirubrum TaxID=3133147 RepID=A0ABU9N8Q4_9FLAO